MILLNIDPIAKIAENNLPESSLNVFLIMGLMLIIGYFSEIMSGRLKWPHVVLYVVTGLIIGRSGLNIINEYNYPYLEILNVFAISLIGFAIGGELKFSDIKELGKTIPIITIFQSAAAFCIVLISVFFVTKSWVLALILGAIASATDPAAPANVLWQYGSKGPLATTIISVVGLDDALTLIIYAFAGAFAKVILIDGDLSLFQMLYLPLIEIFGSLLLGSILGYGVHLILRTMQKRDEVLIVVLGAILLCAGISKQFKFSMILSCMTMGMLLINISFKNRGAFDVMHRFIPPFLVVLFILVGASLDLGSVWKLGFVGLAYLIARSIGKIYGAKLGAVLSKAKPNIKKYLGISLLCQAGVAIGLAMEASQSLRNTGPEGAKLAATIITVTVASVFIFEIIGPPLVKYAIFSAGEVDERYYK